MKYFYYTIIFLFILMGGYLLFWPHPESWLEVLPRYLVRSFAAQIVDLIYFVQTILFFWVMMLAWQSNQLLRTHIFGVKDFGFTGTRKLKRNDFEGIPISERGQKLLDVMKMEALDLRRTSPESKHKSSKTACAEILETSISNLSYCLEENLLQQFPKMSTDDFQKLSNHVSLYHHKMLAVAVGAPGLGFLGTVVGLIFATSNLDNLMIGISNALITTFIGLVVMLVATFFDHQTEHQLNLLDRILLEEQSQMNIALFNPELLED